MVKNALLSSARRFSVLVKWCQSYFHYKATLCRNYYPCKIIGQKITEAGHTIILYSTVGKRDLYEISIHDLMQNEKLINQFKPSQAVLFGVIISNDLLLDFSEPEKQQELEILKHKLLK